MKAKQVKHINHYNGDVIIDNYHWLRADDWQKILHNPENLNQDIRKFLEDANKEVENFLSDTGNLQASIVEEIKQMIQEEDESIKLKDGNYLYYHRYEKNQEHPIYLRSLTASNEKNGNNCDDAEETLLDPNKLSEGKAFFKIGSVSHSSCSRYFAYSFDEKGNESYKIAIKEFPDILPSASRQIMENLQDNENNEAGKNDNINKINKAEQGRLLKFMPKNTSGDFIFFGDSRIIYIVLNDNHRGDKVMMLDFLSGKETELFTEKTGKDFINICRSASGRFCFLSVGNYNSNEVYFLDRENFSNDTSFESLYLFQKRKPQVKYSLEHNDNGGNYFYILTNYSVTKGELQKDFLIEKTTLEEYHNQSVRQEFIPHQCGRLIENMTMFKDFIAIETRADAKPQIEMYNLKKSDSSDCYDSSKSSNSVDLYGKKLQITFDAKTYDAYLLQTHEYETDKIIYAYSALNCPKEHIEYCLQTGSKNLLKKQKLGQDFNQSDYHVDMLFAKADDNSDIPISLIYKKSAIRNSSANSSNQNFDAPLLLYGYGSYGYSCHAGFNTCIFPLLERGFIFAMSHIRGGKDKGYSWYENGKKLAKKNTFYDFVASAKYLIATGFTSADKLFARGGSAGGMLMGFIANEFPDLFKAVIAEVPFTDVLNTMMDKSLPLTPPEWEEWGNPIEDKATYEYIKSYSPYDNIKKQAYPYMFLTAGLTDPRVTYWEPAKMKAKLEEYNIAINSKVSDATNGINTDDNTDDNIGDNAGDNICEDGCNKILLHTEMEAGHAGKAGRYEHLKERALIYSFMLKILH